MAKYVSLEFFKMKHRGIFLTILGLLAVEIGWSFMAFANGSGIGSYFSDASKPVWEFLITSILTLKSLIFPVLISVTVSRVADMEHKGNTWKLLESSAQTRECIWRAKFTSVALLMTIAQILETVFLVVLGNSRGIAEAFPMETCLKYFLGSMAVNALLLAIQQWISLTVENQIVSMAVGIVGAFIGLFSVFLPASVRYLLPWGYYSDLSPTVQADGALAAGEFPYAKAAVSWMPVLIAAGAAAVIYLLGRRAFVKSER